MNSCQSLVSVIIPAFNAEALLGETLKSVLDQSYKPIEIIVVDDGSTDGTAELVASYTGTNPFIRYIYQENSGGCSSPRNHGMKLAKGEFVTFFDADDLMEETKIERQVYWLEQYANADFVVFDYINFDDDGLYGHSHFKSCKVLDEKLSKNGRFLFEEGESCSLLLSENFTIASSPLYKKRIIEDLGGYSEVLKSCEDFHLNYRAGLKFQMLVVDEIGFRRRLHRNNMSANNERMLRNYVKSREDLLMYDSDKRRKNKINRRIAEYLIMLAEKLASSGNIESYKILIRAILKIRHFDSNLLIRCVKVIPKLILKKIF